MELASPFLETVVDAANVFSGSAMVQLEGDPFDEPAENVSGGFRHELSQRRGLATRFWVNSEQTGKLETIGKEDQIPTTLDTPKISELVVFKAEILIGIPEKLKNVSICHRFEYVLMILVPSQRIWSVAK
jgi:hypothetical protein